MEHVPAKSVEKALGEFLLTSLVALVDEAGDALEVLVNRKVALTKTVQSALCRLQA